jgi:protein-tyrosine phosphatase
MTKILMVCLGNICRSPLAEGILKSKLNLKDYIIDSAGMGNYHVGELPDKRSIQVANENKIDITYQRARQFTPEDFDNYDLIYAMDNLNYTELMKMSKSEEHKAKVKIILNEVFPDENIDVPDPYYDSIYAFRNVYKMLDEACEKIAVNLKNR